MRVGTTFTLETPDAISLFVYRWLPEKLMKAVVQIAHGWAEHAGRYARVADALCREGYTVYANDHRGHGHTASASTRTGRTESTDALWTTRNLIEHLLPVRAALAATSMRSRRLGRSSGNQKHCRAITIRAGVDRTLLNTRPMRSA